MPKTYDPSGHHLAVNNGTKTYEPPSLADLKATAEGENIPGAPQFIRDWQGNFDYVFCWDHIFRTLFQNFWSKWPRIRDYRVEKPASPEPRQ